MEKYISAIKNWFIQMTLKKWGVVVTTVVALISLTLLPVVIKKQQETRSRASGEAAILSILPTTITKGVNQNFDVQLMLNGTTFNITGVDITLHFDPAILTIASGQPSSVFPALLHNDINNTSGTYRLTLANAGTTTITGATIALGSITFQAKALGSSQLGFTASQITASGQTAALSTDMSQVATYTVNAAPAPTDTPAPTATSAATPTINILATSTLAPTTTPIPGSLLLNFIVPAQAIGVDTRGNKEVIHPQRNLFICFYEIARNPIGDDNCDNANYKITKNNGLSYDTNAQSSSFRKFVSGVISIPGVDVSKKYRIFVKSDRYLRTEVPGAQNLTLVADTATQLPETGTMIAGDINGDNVIDIRDFNILKDCGAFAIDKQPSILDSAAAGTIFKAALCQAHTSPFPYYADLNDDGFIDYKDHLFYILSLTAISGR